MESTIKHLIVHPKGFPGINFITQTNNDGEPTYDMDDYSCFAGGNFLLGGAYLGRKDFEKVGLALTDSCHRLYNTTVSGLNPLIVAWYGPDNKASNPVYNGDSDIAKKARAYYDKAGYFLPTESNGLAGLYTLYPEPIESMFYAYRITGDSKWQDRNWEIFRTIKTNCQRGDVQASSLSDVAQPKGGDYSFFGLPRLVQVQVLIISLVTVTNFLFSSYFMAETFKYLYLSFSDPDLVSLDDFQFNTQGHPLRIQGRTCAKSR